MEGANHWQIAKNCRTSVEMIEKFYAAHIKDLLDTSAINVMRPKVARQPVVVPKESKGGKSAKRASPLLASAAVRITALEKSIPK